MNHPEHQYIDRATGNVVRERLIADAVIGALYSPALENAPWLTRLASSRYVSRALGYLNYDNLLSSRATGMLRFLRESGIQTLRVCRKPVGVRHTAQDFRTPDSLLELPPSSRASSRGGLSCRCAGAGRFHGRSLRAFY